MMKCKTVKLSFVIIPLWLFYLIFNFVFRKLVVAEMLITNCDSELFEQLAGTVDESEIVSRK